MPVLKCWRHKNPRCKQCVRPRRQVGRTLSQSDFRWYDGTCEVSAPSGLDLWAAAEMLEEVIESATEAVTFDWGSSDVGSYSDGGSASVDWGSASTSSDYGSGSSDWGSSSSSDSGSSYGGGDFGGSSDW